METPLTTPDFWKLDDALELIRPLQKEVGKFNYHVCLGGGVLNKGFSHKDLDLYFLPLSAGDGKSEELKGFLVSLWGEFSEFKPPKSKVKQRTTVTVPADDGLGWRTTPVTPLWQDFITTTITTTAETVWANDTIHYEEPKAKIEEAADDYPNGLFFRVKGKFNYSDLRIDVFIV